MSLVSDYLTEVKPEIDGGIELALDLFTKPRLKEKIHEFSFKNVYSNPDGYTREKGLTARAEASRRYTIGVVEDSDISIQENTLTIRLEKELQNGELGEVEIVEEGTTHNQPYPRPFLKPAVDDYAFFEADMDVSEALRMVGFDAISSGTADVVTDDDLPY